MTASMVWFRDRGYIEAFIREAQQKDAAGRGCSRTRQIPG
jgi:hypothetical protein